MATRRTGAAAAPAGTKEKKPALTQEEIDQNTVDHLFEVAQRSSRHIDMKALTNGIAPSVIASTFRAHRLGAPAFTEALRDGLISFRPPKSQMTV